MKEECDHFQVESVDVWSKFPKNDEVLVSHLTTMGRAFKTPLLASDNTLAEWKEEQKETTVQEQVEDDDQVLKQLEKTQANILIIWGLLLASKPHGNVLFKLLNNSQVSLKKTSEEVAELVTSIIVHKFISSSFFYNELPRGKTIHTNVLHVTIKFMEKLVSVIQIDNGFVIDVCLLRTTNALVISPKSFSPSTQAVRAYDNTRREVIVVTLLIFIGPVSKNIDFQVLDVPTYFNLFLGKTWIHGMLVLLSTLHQRVKFPYEDIVVTNLGDSKLCALASSSISIL